MSTKYQKKQQKRAKAIFWWLAGALLVSFIGVASVTFKWWPYLKSTNTQAVALLDEAAQFEEQAANLPDEEEAAELLQTAEEKTTKANRALAELETFQYLAWVFAAWAGASVYLIGQIATYYPKIKESEEEDDKADFVKYTYWYASTFLKAPILALVVMWFLVNLNIELGADGATNAVGVAVNFSQFGPYVMIGVAFVLGFYGRVTRKQLDIIAKYLFTRAWALAEQGFELVVPSVKSILINDVHTFTTNPPMDVVWSATLGTIDPEKGTYEAPKELSAHNKETIIRASLKAEPASTDFAKIALKALRIKGDNKLKEGEDASLSLETKLEGFDLTKATWKVDSKDVGTGETYKFERKPGTYRVSVTATHTAKETKEDGTEKDVTTSLSDEMEIKVEKK